MSLVEAIANILVGYGLAVLAQMLVFPIFGLQTSLADNLAIGAIFTAISLARSHATPTVRSGPGTWPRSDHRWADRPAASSVLRLLLCVLEQPPLELVGAAMLSVTVLPKRSAPAGPT
jgi:hypothetical protein